ncbi:SDR family NAD(P)-dependent oxidoreductase [Peredibacter sp. HCB2-198]|uniref:SDR family NAD(P)-dependent oxidoreductase n=1 Tax=Peredibacter sp. HCB2-198 TaxID=3383025 RepID=UPI0038B5D6DB
MKEELKNKVVLITGGSKGLGYVLAEHLIKEECKIAICARDESELENAKDHLGKDVLTLRCDVSKEEEVNQLVSDVIKHFGKLDILINNAGVIQVGPMETFKRSDFETAMDIMYWGIVNTTLAVLPHMKERKDGHIVNVTSIGGKISVPHLLPYSAAKFAAVGFSEGIAVELRKDNIFVTTVVPWLMRTGSYVNAFFQRGNKKEFKLFAFSSTAPLLTISADKAARRIVKALKERKAFKIVGFQAGLLNEIHHFFPNLSVKVLGTVSEFIPAEPKKAPLEKGKSISERFDDAEVPGAREVGKKAQADHQELRH